MRCVLGRRLGWKVVEELHLWVEGLVVVEEEVGDQERGIAAI